MKITDKFQKIKADLSPVGLRRGEFVNYFCTPLKSLIFADLGVDGIHFCVIPSKKDKTLESSPIYVVSPSMSDHYVEPIAENFYDFISIVVTIKDAGALECVSYCSEEKFINYLKDIPNESSEITQAITALKENFDIKDIPNVYEYVKKIQQNTALKKVKFSPEYYDVTGEGGPTSATCTIDLEMHKIE
jgi:hypothetical protein